MAHGRHPENRAPNEAPVDVTQTGLRPSKTLVLLRHAKAVRGAPFEDHVRPLTDRGWRDAVAAGRLLAARSVVADRVLCSTALRTQQTWNGAAQGGARSREVLYLEGIYAASTSRLTQLVRDQPEEARVLLLVGHAPGLRRLAELLSDRSSIDVERARMNRKFSTCGMASFRFDGFWPELGRTQAELVGFDVPRG